MLKLFQSILATPGQVVRSVQAKGTPPRTVTMSIPVNKVIGGSLLQKSGCIRLPVSQLSNLKVINTPQQQQQQPKIKQEPGLSPSSTPTHTKTHISSILDHSGSRKRQDLDNDFTPE